MRAFLPLALLALTACYSPRSVPAAGPYYEGEGTWEVQPLEASVWYNEHSGYATFDVSRPANVAIFALRPGAGVEMIYPGFGTGRRTSFVSGTHLVRTAGSPYRLTGNWSMAHGQGPMYILLVASEGPLDVGHFHATRTVSWLNRSAVTYSPYMTLEAIVGEIVPNPDAGRYTTALHVVWPDAAGPYRPYDRPRYMKVQCASGIIVSVPMNIWIAGHPVCPEHVPPPSDSVMTDSTGEIRDAVPTRPQPPQGWIVASIGNVDLRKELDRLRDEHGKKDQGRLALAPYPGRDTDGRSRSRTGFARDVSRDDGVISGPRNRHGVSRSRPATRPSAPAARPARDRPEPSARPEPAARPRPTPPPRPVARPTPPPRPKSPTRPVKPPKPPTGNGGGGGDPG